MSEIPRTNQHIRWPIWLAYAVLLAIAVPWYWPSGDATLWLGLPAWVVVALLANLAASLLTAWLLLKRWPDSGNDESDTEPTGDLEVSERSIPSTNEQ